MSSCVKTVTQSNMKKGWREKDWVLSAWGCCERVSGRSVTCFWPTVTQPPTLHDHCIISTAGNNGLNMILSSVCLCFSLILLQKEVETSSTREDILDSIWTHHPNEHTYASYLWSVNVGNDQKNITNVSHVKKEKRLNFKIILDH